MNFIKFSKGYSNNYNQIKHSLKLMYEKLKIDETVVVGGNKTVELLNHQLYFNDLDSILNIDDIFKTKPSYIDKELQWYLSMNPNGEDIAKHAQIWSTTSDKRGMTNSNYGYLIFSPQNCYQFDNVKKRIIDNPSTRKALMYYSNPNMHYTGGNDHVCTTNVAYYVRDSKLHCTVNMRSNDIVYGLIGADLNWQIFVLNKLRNEILLESNIEKLELGTITWNAVSLHIYERHFDKLTKLIKQ